MPYKRILLQKMPTTAGGSHGPMKDTALNFSVYGMTIPFGVGGEAKNLPNNDWIDENGVEEYVPASGIPLQAFEIDLGFVFRTAAGQSARSIMKVFRDYLTGKDGSGVWMMLYSEYTDVGWQNVRFVSMDVDPTYKQTNLGEVVVFNVRLKVCDPITRVKLSDGGTELVAVS